MKQKIFFWIDADITSFCIPYYLQKVNDAEFYAIIDITNKPKKLSRKYLKQERVCLWKNLTRKKTPPNP